MILSRSIPKSNPSSVDEIAFAMKSYFVCLYLGGLDFIFDKRFMLRATAS